MGIGFDSKFIANRKSTFLCTGKYKILYSSNNLGSNVELKVLIKCSSQAFRNIYGKIFCNKISLGFRSSHQSCATKKGVLKNFAKFTGIHMCQTLFFIKLRA